MRECRRVLLHRAAVRTLLLLTLIGGVLFWLHTKSSVVSEDYPAVYTRCYHELLAEYAAFRPEEIPESELKLRAKHAIISGSLVVHLKTFGRDTSFEAMLAARPEYAQALENGELQRYFDEPLLAQAEQEAIETLQTQIRYLNDFNSYYAAIKQNAARMQRSKLFGDPDSFAYRNVLKTVADFSAIDGARGTLGDDRAVTAVFDDPITDYLVLLFMAVICVLMLAERKSGLWQLIRATRTGRARLALERIFTLFVSAILATGFLFGSRAFISYYVYDGLRYGSRLIQSVQGCSGIPLPMTINQFMLLYCGIKIVCSFSVGLLLYLLLSSVKSLNLAIAVTGAVLALEYALYAAVRDSSILVPLKYVNVFQIIVPYRLAVRYLNLNLFEYPVNVRTAVGAAMGLLSVAAAIGILLVHCRKRPVSAGNPLEALLDVVRRKTYRIVWMQETGKALFAERGILVIALLVLVFLSFGKLPEPTVNEEQRAVISYYRKYAGSVSEETLVSIDRDIEAAEEQLTDPNDSVSIMQIRKQIRGLETLRSEAQDIIARNASGQYGEEIKLIPPYTYMILFGQGSRRFEIGQGLKALLCITLLTAGLYAYENQSGMTKLLRSLPKGRACLFWRKEGITLAFAALVFLAVYLPELLALASSELYGGFSCFSFPMQGLAILRDSRLPISVGGMTVLFYLVRFFMLFLVGSAVGFISSLTKRINTSLLASLALFVVPACLTAMGIDLIYNFTPLPVLFVADAIFYHDFVPFLGITLALLAMTCGTHVINCRAYISQS